MSEDVFTITLKIAGRNIRLNIPRAEEVKYRKVARRLNALIDFYKERYAECVERDFELILLMSAIHIGTDWVEEFDRADVEPLLQKMQGWSSEVDEQLKTE